MIPVKFRKHALDNPWLLVLVNLLGSGFGYWYYRYSILENPVYTWPFIPVSPNATLFMAISIGLYALGRKSRWTKLVDALAFIGNLKYGLWVVVVMLSTPSAYLQQTSEPMFLFLVISHALMASQALLVLDYTEITLEAVFGSGTWYALLDILHYFGPMLHTPLPPGASFVIAGLAALSLTFTGIWAYLSSESELFWLFFGTVDEKAV